MNQNSRTSTLIMRGLSATQAAAQARREAIREYHQRYGFEAACERYGESQVRAAWLPGN
jgi:hypothetical protein